MLTSPFLKPFTLLTLTQKSPARASKGDGPGLLGAEVVWARPMTMWWENARATVVCFACVKAVEFWIKNL